MTPISGPVLRHKLAIMALACVSCSYGFSGGGFPPEIRTVAVIPFENLTTDPTLTAEINAAVREAVERRLGLRQVGENNADAVVTGTIRRYDPDLPVAFTGDQTTGQVSVTKRLVQISVDVEVRDRVGDKVLWSRQGMLVEGEYESGQERQGRAKALDKLITNIVDGAQSQW